MKGSGFTTDIIAALSAAAIRNGLDPLLLAALIAKESSGNTLAGRYEDGYPYLWDVNEKKPRRWDGTHAIASIGTCSGGTERVWQQCSWGLCQVMGATAREMGFAGEFLSGLLVPEEGTEYGARYLARLIKRHGVADGLSAYNAGQPTEHNFRAYVSPILQTAERYKREGL